MWVPRDAGEHPVVGERICAPLKSFRSVLPIIRHHHEKFDGSGYPDGLKGEQIPLPARLFAVMDVFDALTSNRPYRPAWSKQEAINYVRDQSGRHFDPNVVSQFMKLIAEEKIL